MLAFRIPKAHIDLLVEAFFRYEIAASPLLTPDKLGTLLREENYHAVNVLCGERLRPRPYQHSARTACKDLWAVHHAPRGQRPPALGTVAELVRKPLVVYKQCRCYSYQTCERPGWHHSYICVYVHMLEAAILKHLGMTEDQCWSHPAWNDAPWGIC